jgi:hypothetical protein
VAWPKPGQPLGIKLGATIPAGVKITGLAVTFEEVGASSTTFSPRDLYQDAKQPLGPGQYTFARSGRAANCSPAPSGWPT